MKIFDILKAWLKAIYIKPVPAPAVTESQSSEVNTVSEPIVDAAQTAAVDPAVVVEPAVIVQPTPAQEVKAGVQDFEAALTFVESGVAQLGEAAKDELKLLAIKYL